MSGMGTDGQRNEEPRAPETSLFGAGATRGIDADLKVKLVHDSHAASPNAHETVRKLRIKSVTRGSSMAGELAAAQVLMGPSLESSMDTYAVPDVRVEQDARYGSRAEMIGTLKNFVDYLANTGVAREADWDDELDWHHVLHKYAYIAKRLGLNLGYDFDFLETGAFSVDMDIDLYELSMGSGGIVSFAGKQRASDAFVELVRGKNMEWLQIATFAFRELEEDQTGEEFAKKSRGRMTYDRQVARDAYGRINALRKKLSVSEP